MKVGTNKLPYRPFQILYMVTNISTNGLTPGFTVFSSNSQKSSHDKYGYKLSIGRITVTNHSKYENFQAKWLLQI